MNDTTPITLLTTAAIITWAWYIIVIAVSTSRDNRRG